MAKTFRPLLFVNKTGSTQKPPGGNASESAAILRHVQRNRRDAEGRRREPQWQKMSSVFASLDDTDSQDTPSETTDEKAGVTQAVTCSYPPMTTKYPTSNAFDPFHCTAIGTDAGNHSLLRFTFSSLAQANFLSESFAPDYRVHGDPKRVSATSHQYIFELRLQRCIQDPMLMYATLGYSASFLGWMTGHLHYNKPQEYFLAQALSAVRIHLAQPGFEIDDWLLLSIYALAVTELWNGLPSMWKLNVERRNMAMATSKYCFDASRVHLRALLHLAARAGGWDRFSPYVLDSIILGDKYLAISTRQPPLMAPTWDPGRLCVELRAKYSVAGDPYPRLGVGFAADTLDSTLQEELEHLVDYAKSAHLLWSNESVDPTIQLWLFRRLQAIKFRLMTKAHDEEFQPSDRCVTLATLIFISVSLIHKGRSVAAAYLSRSLEIELSETKGQMSKGLRFWCLCMGALLPDSRSLSSFYTVQLQKELELHESKESVESVLSEYLYLPERHGIALGELFLCIKYRHRSDVGSNSPENIPTDIQEGL